MSKPKLAGQRSRTMDQRIPVFMTAPQWRALAAVLWSATTITTDPIHATLLKSLYDEIQSQANVPITPVNVEEKEE